jgi:hypothetical protein
MDKVINTHIDRVEDIEAQIERVIDQEIAQIDIDLVLKNPDAALSQVIENVKEIFFEKYAHDAMELGFQFGEMIQKRIDQDKPIKVDDSQNPTLNA